MKNNFELRLASVLSKVDFKSEEFRAFLRRIKDLLPHGFRITTEGPVPIHATPEDLEQALRDYHYDVVDRIYTEEFRARELAASIFRAIGALKAVDFQLAAAWSRLDPIGTACAGSVASAIDYRDRLLQELEIVAHDLTWLSSETKNPANRPARYDLRRLVGNLAEFWKDATGSELKYGWHRASGKNGGPTNASCAFVCEVVQYIDPASLPNLPEAIKNVVRQRRLERCPGYWNERSRSDAEIPESRKRKTLSGSKSNSNLTKT